MAKRKQILNEYLMGGISFRIPDMKHVTSCSTLNRRVLEYQGFICIKKSSGESISLPEMNKKPRTFLWYMEWLV